MTPSDHACLALQVCLRAPGQGKTISPVLQVISRGATTSITFLSFVSVPNQDGNGQFKRPILPE